MSPKVGCHCAQCGQWQDELPFDFRKSNARKNAGSVVSTLVGLLLIAAFAGAVWMSKREGVAG